jgi:hypothetical protein
MNLLPSSQFGRDILIRIIRKMAKKKLGYDVDMQIENLRIDESSDNQHVCLSANFKISLRKADVEKIVDKL